MRRLTVLLATMGLLLFGVAPATASETVYESEFQVAASTGGSGEYFISGYGIGEGSTAIGEFDYYHPEQPERMFSAAAHVRVHDLKCLVVVPSENETLETDYNVLAVGRLEVLDGLDGDGRFVDDSWGSVVYAPDSGNYGAERPINFYAHEFEPSCDVNEFFESLNQDGWWASGFFIDGFVEVREVQPVYDSPPRKVDFNESYEMPADRPLVEAIDPGWLNIGCGGGEFESPEEPGTYPEPGVLYEMTSGELKAKWKAKFVGVDADGAWLYEMTQDFDWKNAVFEGGTNSIHISTDGDWSREWVGSGEFFDLVAGDIEFDVLVRVVNPYGEIWPGNIEPIDGRVSYEFALFDETGERVDWVLMDGEFVNGEFEGVAEGTCG